MDFFTWFMCRLARFMYLFMYCMHILFMYLKGRMKIFWPKDVIFRVPAYGLANSQRRQHHITITPIDSQVYSSTVSFLSFIFPLLFSLFLSILSEFFRIRERLSDRVMGNIITLCVKKSETDQEHSERSGEMATNAVYETSPFEGQKPGTSGRPCDWDCAWFVGLRKRVKVFMQKNYTENFVQVRFLGNWSDGRRFLRQFRPPAQRARLLSLEEMGDTTTKKSCKS